MRITILLLALLLLASCKLQVGTSTTTRPAIDKPVVGPDGAFWDAANVARGGNVDAFLFLLTPRWIHSELWPSVSRADPETADAYNEQHNRLNRELAQVDAERRRFAQGHMERLARVLEDRYVEVSRPSFNIKYRDGTGRAAGPNQATVTVRAWERGEVAESAEPDTFQVSFKQYGQRWLIDGIEPDPLQGTFQIPLTSRPTPG